MKKNKYIGVILAATMLTATSCSDFSDYNDTPADANPAGNQTLWQNISANGDLTDFASLVKKAGFDVELDNSKSFTVWAPKNGTFNVTDYASLSKEDLLQQFVKNHIAEYGHITISITGLLIQSGQWVKTVRLLSLLI